MKKLYEGNIRRNFLAFSLPLIVTVFFSQAHSIINTVMSSRMIGEEAISAIGSTAPFISFISSVYWGYGVGFSVYVAILFGSENYDKMANIIKINMIIISLFVILISAICVTFHNQIFDFLNIEQALRKDSFAYFSVYMIGLVFLNINQCGIYISNAFGATKLPLVASFVSNILNIFTNYILIKYFGMGVEGTAIATVFSAICVSVFYVVMIVKIFKQLGVRVKGIYFDISEIIQSFIYAVPSLLQQSIMYLCTALVSPLTNLCGASAIAGYTVGMRIYDVEAGIYQNSNKTVSTYVAQCVGAKKHSMIKIGIKIGITQTIIILSIFLVPVILGADFISEIFLDLPESMQYSNIFIKYCMPFIFFNVINNLLHAVFRSAGAGKYLIISTLVYAISRFGFSYILFDKFEMYGIYTAIVLSWVTEALFAVTVYLSGKWKNAEFK